MKQNATISVPLGGAFWDGGAQVFINKGVNGRWSETLTVADCAEYEARAVRELGPECARWLAGGRVSSDLLDADNGRRRTNERRRPLHPEDRVANAL
jgi:aryl sulfotransferase